MNEFRISNIEFSLKVHSTLHQTERFIHISTNGQIVDGDLTKDALLVNDEQTSKDKKNDPIIRAEEGEAEGEANL